MKLTTATLAKCKGTKARYMAFCNRIGTRLLSNQCVMGLVKVTASNVKRLIAVGQKGACQTPRVAAERRLYNHQST